MKLGIVLVPVPVLVLVVVGVVMVRVRMMKEGKMLPAGFVYKCLGTRIRGNKQTCGGSTLTAVAYSNSKMLEYIGQYGRRYKHAEKVKSGE
jgi:hypothetical protein